MHPIYTSFALHLTRPNGEGVLRCREHDLQAAGSGRSGALWEKIGHEP
jgi:hypothetical protein